MSESLTGMGFWSCDRQHMKGIGVDTLFAIIPEVISASGRSASDNEIAIAKYRRHFRQP